MTPCAVAGCTGTAGVPGTARGLCSAHYNRQRRHGSLELPWRPVPVRLLTCEYPLCPKPQRAHGYCSTHWKRLHTHGDVETCNRAPNWTPQEDARLLDLPLTGNGAVKTGYLLDLCDRLLDRPYKGCVSRLYKLRAGRYRGRSDQTPAAALAVSGDGGPTRERYPIIAANSTVTTPLVAQP